MKQHIPQLKRISRGIGRICIKSVKGVLGVLRDLVPLVILMPVAATCWLIATLSSDWHLRVLLYLCMGLAWCGAVFMIETRVRRQTQNEIYKNFVAAIAAGKKDD